MRIWPYKNADEKAHTFSTKSKNVKKRTNTYEKRILCKFTFNRLQTRRPHLSWKGPGAIPKKWPMVFSQPLIRNDYSVIFCCCSILLRDFVCLFILQNMFLQIILYTITIMALALSSANQTQCSMTNQSEILLTSNTEY